MNLHGKYESYDNVVFTRGTYEKGGTAVRVFCEDGEPIATLSVYIRGISETLFSNEFCFMDASQNEGFLESMIANDLIEHTGRVLVSSRLHIVPIVRLKNLWKEIG